MCGGLSDRLQEGIDFYVLRRHCNDCKLYGWVFSCFTSRFTGSDAFVGSGRRKVSFRSNEIDKLYPAQPKELFNYVFHTPVNSLGPAFGASKLLQYWHKDVLPIIDTWNQFQEDLKDENRAAEFEDWKETRRKAIALRVEVSPQRYESVEKTS